MVFTLKLDNQKVFYAVDIGDQGGVGGGEGEGRPN